MPLLSGKPAIACNGPKVHLEWRWACTLTSPSPECRAWQRTAVVVVLLQVRAKLLAIGVDALRVRARAGKRAAAVQAGHDGVGVCGAHVATLAAARARQRFSACYGCQEPGRHRSCSPLAGVCKKRTGRCCAPHRLATGKRTLWSPWSSLPWHVNHAYDALLQANKTLYKSLCNIAGKKRYQTCLGAVLAAPSADVFAQGLRQPRHQTHGH